MRFVLVIAWIALFAWLLAGALDQEFARAEGLPDDAMIVSLHHSQAEKTVQGKGVVWWSKRAVQARKDANARKQTILRLRRAQAKDAAHFFSWLAAAECVHLKEARWNYNGPTYDGGMQADRSFQRAYGPVYLARWGPAYLWPWWAQLHMAYNGWVVRGWQPWPNTARRCGLL